MEKIVNIINIIEIYKNFLHSSDGILYYKRIKKMFIDFKNQFLKYDKYLYTNHVNM